MRHLSTLFVSSPALSHILRAGAVRSAVRHARPDRASLVLRHFRPVPESPAVNQILNSNNL